MILVQADTPFLLVLLGANANNLLLIPMAYGVLHLAMGERPGRRMSTAVEIGLLLTIVPIGLLRWLPPPTSAFMLHSRGADPATGQACDRVAWMLIQRELERRAASDTR